MMRRLALTLALLAGPALAQQPGFGTTFETDLSLFTISSSATTAIVSKGCTFATIGADGSVTIDRACLEKASSAFKSGAVNNQWDVIAYLIKAAIEKNYSGASK